MFPLNRNLLHEFWEENVHVTESLVGSSGMPRAMGTLQESSEQWAFFVVVFNSLPPNMSVSRKQNAKTPTASSWS